MKARGMIVSLGAVIILSNAYCASGSIRPDHIVPTEDQAIEQLGNDLHNRFAANKNLKIGIINFTTLGWKPTNTGARLAEKLSNYLAAKKKMNIAERTGLDRIMAALAIEQAGSYSAEKAKKIETKVPVDAVIMGTVSRIGNEMRIELSALDVKTGHMSHSYGARVLSPMDYAYKDTPEIISIHEKSPEKLREMNKSYILLYWMETHQPLLFLIAVLDDKEMKGIKETNAVLHGKLKVRKERLDRDRPDIIGKFENLRAGIKLMGKYDSQRYAEIMGWKDTLIRRMR
jgi:hypothetical protein